MPRVGEVKPKQRTPLTSPKIKALATKKKKVRRRKVTIFAVCMCALLAGFVFLASWKEVNIVDIKIKGNNVTDTDLLASAVSSELDGEYLGLIPKTNFALYPKSKIMEKLSQNFKRLKDIKITATDPKTLEVSVSERDIKYAWCGKDFAEGNIGPEEKPCYFMDSSGYIFDEAPYFSGGVYFRFYGDVLGSVPGSYFDEQNFQKMDYYVETIRKLGLDPVALRKTSDEDIEIFLDRPSDDSPKILIKLDEDQYKVMDALGSALGSTLKEEITKNKSNLLYIDLRFDNKVYYKFR